MHYNRLHILVRLFDRCASNLMVLLSCCGEKWLKMDEQLSTSNRLLMVLMTRVAFFAHMDFLKQTNAINSGVGLKLMQKMGWTPGEGLGKGRDGPLEPLVLDIKSDRKGKHPVSVLMELCSKKRWHVPQFTCLESGPSNNRRFLWKAIVNGVEYQPSIASTSKKTGKAQACQVVLQSLGLVPRDPSLPIIL
ncbi:Protein SON [Dirofilaria immitis]|nr:Protein SON [Dirofilaria immitis]